MRASERYWHDVARGEVTIALPANLEDHEDMDMLVGLTLNPSPSIFAALHAPDPGVRTRALLSAMRDAGRVVEKQYPQIKVVK